MKSSHLAALFGVVLLGVLVLMGVLLYPVINKNTGGITIGQTTIPGQTGGTNSSCTVGVAPSLQVKVVAANASGYNPQVFAVGAQPISVYQIGAASVFQSSTSVPSGSAAVTGLNTCTHYTTVTGNNIATNGYFLNGSTGNTYIGLQPSPSITLTILPYSAPTLQAQNATSAALATTARYHTATASSSVTTVNIATKAGTNWDSQGPGILVLTYNSLAMTPPSISGSGVSQVSGGILNGYSPTFLTTNAAVTQYAFVGVQNAYVAYYVPSVSNGASFVMNPQFQLKSAYGTNEIISGTWIPVTLLEFNGNLQAAALSPTTSQPIFTATTDTALVAITPQ